MNEEKKINEQGKDVESQFNLELLVLLIDRGANAGVVRAVSMGVPLSVY